jgi:hypothetical protein
MKNIVTLTILFIALIACTAKENAKGDQPNSTTIKLDGFWLRSYCDFDFHAAMQTMGCPDPELMALHHPEALGSHFLIKADSILFFQYPFRYLGSSKYKIFRDSLYIRSSFRFVDNFLMKMPNEDSLLLGFHEKFNDECRIISKAEYERFVPDLEIINQLIKDSVYYAPLVGRWWHLRKEIGYNDGSEPTILKFPRGMPDSIFVSQEMINRNSPRPYIDLKLNRRTVRMHFQAPCANSFTLEPALISDKILFSDSVDYGGGYITSAYFDVVYQEYRDF